MENERPDIFDLGLAADLEMWQRRPVDRRGLLRLGAAGLTAFLTGCATTSAQSNPRIYLPLVEGSATPTSSAAPTATATTGPAACVDEIPQETAGPYPADGSNASNQALNVLTRSGVVRSDIRSSISTGTTAAGVPLTIVLSLVNAADNCTPLAGYAMYLWHCNRDGDYSLYSSGVTDEDYLRGVQAASSDGTITFTSIFPGCYSGRWPHVHFEIYPSLAQATGPANLLHTSQLALPEEVCATVYVTTGYSDSARNLGQISLATDNIFSDGYGDQMAVVTGDVASGYTAYLTVGVAV